VSSIKIEINEDTLRTLIIEYLSDKLSADITENDVEIQVRSQQNYRAEWERAEFRAVVVKLI
jgi:hypothetical protein